MAAERGLAGGRTAVDADHAARHAAFAPGGLETGADGEPALRRVECGGDRPAGGRLVFAKSFSGLAAADFVEAGTAQAAAGREKGQRLQQIGLARAIAAHQHHGADAAIESKLTVVAEVGQPDLAHGEKRRRCAAYGVGRIGEGTCCRRCHTRIGMRTYKALSSAPSRTSVGEPASAIRKRASAPTICSVMSSR